MLARSKRAGWSVKHSTNTMDALTKWALPILGKLDVDAIETPDVLRVLQQPVLRGLPGFRTRSGPNHSNDAKSLWLTHTQTASMLRNNVRLVLDWATVSGYRKADKPNPARWDGHLEVLLPKPSDVGRPSGCPPSITRRCLNSWSSWPSGKA